jgi:hypothetical protein
MAKGTIKIKGTAGTGGSVILTSIDGSNTQTPIGGIIAIASSGSSAPLPVNVGDMVSFDITPASGGGSSSFAPSGETATILSVLSNATVYSGPLSDNINVGANQCVVINNGAKIDGNIKVEGGVLLVTDAANIYGNIKGSSGAVIIIDGKAVINGNTRISDTGSSPLLYIDGSNLSGNIKGLSVSRVVLNGCTIDGNVDCENSASVTITGNNINGNLKVAGTTSCKVSGNTVSGKTDAAGCVA